MNIGNQASFYYCINKTTVANEDLIDEIKKLKPKWTLHQFKKMSITVDADMRVQINEANILIKKDLGLTIDYTDPDVYSFKILDGGINIYAIVTY